MTPGLTLEDQVHFVELLLKGGMGPADVARYVGWDSKDVRRLQAQLKLEEATGAPGAAAAVAVPAVPTEAARPAAEAKPPDVIATRAPAAPQEPFHRRLGPPQQVRPTLLRALLDWIAPAEGQDSAVLPWRRLLPWAGGVAAALLVAAAVLPRGPASAPLASTVPVPSHYRCALPDGATVLTMNEADCNSAVAGLRQAHQPSVPAVATIKPAAAPKTSTGASTAPAVAQKSTTPPTEPVTPVTDNSPHNVSGSTPTTSAKPPARAAAQSIGVVGATCYTGCNGPISVGTVGAATAGTTALPPAPQTSWLVKMAECGMTRSWGVAGTGCP